MSEQNPESTASETDAPDTSALAAEVAKWKEMSRKNEAKARENAEAAKKLATIEEQSKTETERLVEAARREGEQAGRKAVSAEVGGKLARAEFLAAAAKRNASHDATTILDDLNLTRYVGEDGEPNTKEIAAAVERLIPAPAADPRPKGDAGLGPRTPPPAPVDGNPQSLIAAGLAANAAAKR